MELFAGKGVLSAVVKEKGKSDWLIVPPNEFTKGGLTF